MGATQSMRTSVRLLFRATMDKVIYKSFEEEVGITAFANNCPGFSGVLKQRFSDFVVREVGVDGSLARLTDTSGRELEEKWFRGESSSLTDPSETANKLVVDVSALLADDAKLTEDQITELKLFLVQCIEKSPDCSVDFTGFIAKDKAGRSAIHGLFKGDLSKVIDSTTAQIGDKSVIRLIAKHKVKGSGIKLDKRASQWPTGLPDFLQFTLFKENIDTMSAISILSKNLHVQSGSIGYNGTKDKRGVTAQTCTVYRKKPSDFSRTNNYPHAPLLRAGDFKYVKNEARLGALSGNRFEIILRALDKPIEDIKLAAAGLETSGFINYYGLQRFGKGGSKSHEVGRQIYRNDFKACCDMMFTPYEHDKESLATAKQLYHKGLYKEALDVLPDSCYGEKAVLSGLKHRPTDFNGAYNSIMKNSRLICAHAYQSYIWNMAASRRIELFGFNCVAGDLVPLDSSILSGADVDVLEEVDSSSSEAAADKGNSFQRQQSSSNKNKIHVVTAEDVTSNRFTVRDVILPLPGAEIVFPTNEIGSFYNDLLEKDGLKVDFYTSVQPQYQMRGAYRRLIQMPQDFEWEVIEYQKFNQDIAVTELTALRAKTVSEEESEEFGEAVSDTNNQEEKTEDVHSYSALQLKFTLPSGTYATMLLRELTKESTECQFQAQLTLSSKRSNDRDIVEEPTTKVARID